MAVLFTTADPEALLKRFIQTINSGAVKTWVLSDDKEYFTHTSTQWAKQAWLRAEASEGVLKFNIVRQKGKSISTEAYAEYHALLVRVFLAHFDGDFSNALVTALPRAGDIIAQLG